MKAIYRPRGSSLARRGGRWARVGLAPMVIALGALGAMSTATIPVATSTPAWAFATDLAGATTSGQLALELTAAVAAGSQLVMHLPFLRATSSPSVLVDGAPCGGVEVLDPGAPSARLVCTIPSALAPGGHSLEVGGVILPDLVLQDVAAPVSMGAETVAALESVAPRSDAAVGVRVVVRDAAATSSGGYHALVIAQLVDAAGLATNNGGTSVALSFAPGAGVRVQTPSTSTTPDGVVDVPGCAGAGTAGMTPTAAASGEVLCSLTSTSSSAPLRIYDAASSFESPQPMVGVTPGSVAGVGSAAYDAYLITSQGGVLAVGENPLGELGDGSSLVATATPVPVSLPNGTQIVQIAGGGYFALARTSTGAVFAWGQDDQGQVGNGTTETDVQLPVEVALPTSVTEIAAGCNASYALGANGVLYAWGANYAGQLGDGNRAEATSPVQVALPVAATQIAATCNGGYALGANGVLYAWGSNNAGQLGDGSIGGSVSSPVAVRLPVGTVVEELSAQNSGGYVLSSSGTVLAWGGGALGQLGDGSTSNSTLPVRVATPSGVTIAQVVGGGFDAFAVTTGGELLAWGGNYDGQDGVGSLANVLKPTRVPLPTAVRAVSGASAGGFAALALGTNGVVYAWGANFDDELGIGVLTTNYFTLGLTGNGGLAWGSAPTANFDAQPAGEPNPSAVALPAGTRAVAASAASAYALTSAGTVDAWGANQDGQLGDGTTMASETPVAVSLPVGATQIAASCSDAYALGANGVVYAWGANQDGQLGDGTTMASETPVAVSGVTNATAVAAGLEAAYALTSAGTVYAWGANQDGQLGDGTTAPRATPGPVSLASPASALWAGGNQAFAQTTAGLEAWGSNTTGQLGTGSFFNDLSPTPVALPSGVQVQSVSSPGVSTVVLTTQGSAYAMGGNLFGQLGDGTYFTTATPTLVRTSGLEAVAMGGYANWLEPFGSSVTATSLSLKL